MGYSPWGRKGSDTAEQLTLSLSNSELGRSPEGGNATHSSMLVWSLPRTEEPAWLQSMGLKRVGHD